MLGLKPRPPATVVTDQASPTCKVKHAPLAYLPGLSLELDNLFSFLLCQWQNYSLHEKLLHPYVLDKA